MILQATTEVTGVSELCLSYFSLGGILVLGVAVGYAICTILNRNPTVSLGQSLISNAKALEMIDNFQVNASQGDAASGHLELGALVAFIDKMQTQCKSIGKDLSGLEYYFARYGESDNPPNENQNTIVLYPTYEDGNAHIPFEPYLPFNGGNPVSIFNLNRDFQIDRADAAKMNTSKYTNLAVLNRTHMSPPRQPLTL